MTMDVKTMREGGDNGQLVRLTGPVSYGQLTLKRGMTANFDLWDWFGPWSTDPSLRANAEVVMLARRRHPTARALPAAPMRAGEVEGARRSTRRTACVAIEELQLAYESISYKAPKAPKA